VICYGFQLEYWPMGLAGISNLPVTKKLF